MVYPIKSQPAPHLVDNAVISPIVDVPTQLVAHYHCDKLDYTPAQPFAYDSGWTGVTIDS